MIYQLPEIIFSIICSSDDIVLDGTYTCIEGMTWGEFVNSEYNTIGLMINSYSSCVYKEDDWGQEYCIVKSGTAVLSTDIIESITYKTEIY